MKLLVTLLCGILLGVIVGTATLGTAYDPCNPSPGVNPYYIPPQQPFPPFTPYESPFRGNPNQPYKAPF